MKKFFLFLFLCISFSCFCEPNKAICYHPASRLGDQLLDYARAKWISYKWGIPLYYRPFKYSDELVLHDVEKSFDSLPLTAYQKHVNVDKLEQLDMPIHDSTLFFIHHQPDSIDEYQFIHWGGPYISVDWANEDFRSLIRSLIKPKNKLKLIYPPKNQVSVAMHYRTGRGFDTAADRKILPLRFSNFKFYVEQLKILQHLVEGAKLYVYLFTDDPNPDQILNQFKMAFQSTNIQFDCRAKGNKHNANVLEDLFSMVNFDCLIRPVSHFSITASYIGNFKIEQFPKHGYWDKEQFHIDDVHLIQKSSWDNTAKQWRPLN